MKRLGVDVGGTFTDLIYVDDEAGSILIHKIASTPDDPSRGTVQGIKELSEQANVTPADLDQVFHGTTIATNIVIEHNGATVGMITTEGYRDILHIARHKKPKGEFDIKERYLEIGERRAMQGVALSQLVWVIVLTKENLWDYLKLEVGMERPTEVFGELEMLQLLDQFFDRAIYYASMGYERARVNAVH